ncbi:MAG TPA: oligosaccharide flippase family protein [Bacteroidales bacterium]|nr:oligosaccharide flippase family protein [Bacteroidales bacterium]
MHKPEKRSKFLKIYAKSELLRNTTVLISGTAIAQVIPILLQPILRRSFSTEIFGAYSVYLSLVGILVIICSFKYDVAVILPKKEKEAANVFFLSVFLNIIFNLILFLIIAVWKLEISYFLNLSDSYTNYLLFVPLGTFLFGFYQSINNWLIRRKLYYPISLNKFVRRGFEGAAQVSFKIARIPHFLLYGDIIGHISNVISGIYQIWRNGLSIKLLSKNKFKYVLSKYNEYPKYNLMPALMNACSALLPAIFINKFFSLEIAGYMDLSRMLLTVPVALVSLSLSSVLLQRTSEKYKNNESVLNELKIISLALLAFGILEILVISFFGNSIFVILFGENWAFSAEIAKIIVWSYALTFIVSSFYSLFISLNKIKLLSIWQVIYFFSILSLIFFKNYSFLEFIKIYVYIEVICSLLMGFLLTYIVLSYEKNLKFI